MRRRVVLLALVLQSLLVGATLGRPKKRRGQYSSMQRLINTGISVVQQVAQYLQLHQPTHVYNMNKPGERNELIDALWSDDLLSAVGRFGAANSALVELFYSQDVESIANSDVRMRERSWPRFESVLCSLFRARSNRLVPLETAALSIQWLHYRVPSVVWNTFSQLTRIVMSRTWTEELVDDAVLRDPGPRYPVAQGITAAVFDNLTIRVGYSSFATTESSGHRIDMTNWATAFLPAFAVPPEFSIEKILGAGGLFRTDMSLEDFIDLFSIHSPDIITQQRARWVKLLDAAAADTIWDKSLYDSPFPPTFFHYHDPIFGRLQSSYEDVNFELNLIRLSPHHKYADAVMLGGDGLSFMRLIHRLSQDPRRYLESKPVVIPRMGEAPHGKFHLMHGDWRLWAPLIMRMAALVHNRQIKSDPTVEDFNSHEHFLRILTQAFAEYVVEIAATGVDYHLCPRFLEASEANWSFACIVFFLYHFAFKYLSFRRAVRRNDSHLLDILWRENLSSARTALANKTNYRQMSVVLVYWGCCLVEPLQTVYHNTRTLRWVHSHVGWDMVIEKLNMWIKESVVAHITESLVARFIKRVNFTHVVIRNLKRLVGANRKENKSGTLKDIKADVEIIKQFLRDHLGTTFEAATAPSDENALGVDLSDWGGLRRARERAPWVAMRDTMQDYRAYVREEIAKLCPWHHWAL